MADGGQPSTRAHLQVGHRHNWQALDGYANVVMARLEDLEALDFVERVSIACWFSVEEPWIRLAGHVACRGRLIVTFDKYLEVHPETDRVRVRQYFYNCHVQSTEGLPHFGNVLRYDNAHGRDHDDQDPLAQRVTWHHRHEWDEPSDAEDGGRRIFIDHPDWARLHPENDWPHLDEVVEELEGWYRAHAHQFGLDDGFPDLDRCPPPPTRRPHQGGPGA